jgi:hypothetical protein
LGRRSGAQYHNLRHAGLFTERARFPSSTLLCQVRVQGHGGELSEKAKWDSSLTFFWGCPDVRLGCNLSGQSVVPRKPRTGTFPGDLEPKS